MFRIRPYLKDGANSLFPGELVGCQVEPRWVHKDETRFPDGPWCKEGNWVLITRYAGSRIKIDGGELRIVNDDEILAVIDDPRDILPANIL